MNAAVLARMWYERPEYFGKHLSFNTQECFAACALMLRPLLLFAYLVFLARHCCFDEWAAAPLWEHKFYIVFTQEIDSLSFHMYYAAAAVVIYFCFTLFFDAMPFHSHLVSNTSIYTRTACELYHLCAMCSLLSFVVVYVCSHFFLFVEFDSNATPATAVIVPKEKKLWFRFDSPVKHYFFFL